MNYTLVWSIFALYADHATSLRLREGFHSLRMESSFERGVVSCPNSYVAPSMPNSVVTQQANNVGNMVVVYGCNRGFVSSGAGSVATRQITGTCMTDSSNVTTVDTGGFSCVVGYCSLEPFLAMKHVTISSGTGASIGVNVGVDVVVNIACMTGYTVDGLPTGPTLRQLTCDADTLQFPTSEDCLPVSCGSVVLPSNAIQMSSKTDTLHFGDVVSFACLPGYVYEPAEGPSVGINFSQTCSSTGDMVANEDPTNLIFGQCGALQCPNPPPTFSGADMVAKPTDTFDLFAQIQYVCDAGSHFINTTGSNPVSASGRSLIPTQSSFRVTCIFDSVDNAGVYDTDPRIARCEAPPCPAPPLLASGSHLTRTTPEQDAYFVGDLVEYSCPFESSSDASSECTPNQVWTNLVDDCVPIQCGTLAQAPSVSNAFGVGWDLGAQLNTGDSVAVECDDGFVSSLDGASTVAITCMPDGTYSAQGVSCARQCSPLPAVPANTAATYSTSNMTSSPQYIVGGNMSATQTIVFQCDTGFSLDGETVDESNVNQTLVCSPLPGSSFATSFQGCVPIVCGLPIRVANAGWVDSTKIKQYAAGESVGYTCQNGFGMKSNGVWSSDFKVTCGDTGWTQPSSVCEQVTCSGIATVANGAVLNGTSSINAGDTLSVQCDTGYAGIGFTTQDLLALTCSSTGTLVPVNFGSNLCQQILCPTLPTILLGGTKSSAATALRFGDSPIEYSCDSAWNLPPIVVSCLADGTYDVVGTQCTEPVCSNSLPTELKNTVLMGGVLTAPLGSIQRAGCSPSFTATDGSLEFSVTCIGPGTWSPINPAYVNGCPQNAADVTPVMVR